MGLGWVPYFWCCQFVVGGGDEGDGEPVGGDVFAREDAAEEELAGEGEAEGVDAGVGDEAAELDRCRDGAVEGGELERGEGGRRAASRK
jgi:hypothetical protein